MILARLTEAMISTAALHQMKGSGVVVPMFDPGVDGKAEFFDGIERGVGEALAGEHGEPRWDPWVVAHRHDLHRRPRRTQQRVTAARNWREPQRRLPPHPPPRPGRQPQPPDQPSSPDGHIVAAETAETAETAAVVVVVVVMASPIQIQIGYVSALEV